MSGNFLKAEWRKLAMANYAVDPAILTPYLPYKTETDFWKDTCYVSLVGFMFQNTRVMGLKIPFHTDFEEVNLRFYVRYKEKGNWKRGVVFIKEIVPKPALSFVANTIYGENYETMSTSHQWQVLENDLIVEYKWKKDRWHSLKVVAEKNSSPVAAGSEEGFITEHYWGYTRLSPQKTSEYGVEHPKWEMYKTKDYSIDVDFGQLYSSAFSFLATQKPVSVFLAEGSPIEVKRGNII